MYHSLLQGLLRQCPCQGCRRSTSFQNDACAQMKLCLLSSCVCSFWSLMKPWKHWRCPDTRANPMLYRLMSMQKQYAIPCPAQAQYTSRAFQRRRWVLWGVVLPATKSQTDRR